MFISQNMGHHLHEIVELKDLRGKECFKKCTGNFILVRTALVTCVTGNKQATFIACRKVRRTANTAVSVLPNGLSLSHLLTMKLIVIWQIIVCIKNTPFAEHRAKRRKITGIWSLL